MKKLQFVSVIIVVLLFCPFIKQCEIMKKTAEKPILADSTAVIIDSVSEIKIKNSQTNELKTYFI